VTSSLSGMRSNQLSYEPAQPATSIGTSSAHLANPQRPTDAAVVRGESQPRATVDKLPTSGSLPTANVPYYAAAPACQAIAAARDLADP
jgi:hypothetical protein